MEREGRLADRDPPKALGVVVGVEGVTVRRDLAQKAAERGERAQIEDLERMVDGNEPDGLAEALAVVGDVHARRRAVGEAAEASRDRLEAGFVGQLHRRRLRIRVTSERRISTPCARQRSRRSRSGGVDTRIVSRADRLPACASRTSTSPARIPGGGVLTSIMSRPLPGTKLVRRGSTAFPPMRTTSFPARPSPGRESGDRRRDARRPCRRGSRGRAHHRRHW